jgi:hypothetical protein
MGKKRASLWGRSGHQSLRLKYECTKLNFSKHRAFHLLKLLVKLKSFLILLKILNAIKFGPCYSALIH